MKVVGPLDEVSAHGNLEVLETAKRSLVREPSPNLRPPAVLVAVESSHIAAEPLESASQLESHGQAMRVLRSQRLGKVNEK